MSTTTGPVRPPDVTGATEALDGYLAGEGADRRRPPLRYLRRKPGRGLVAVFGPDDRGEIYTVTVDERSFQDASDGDPSVPGATVQHFPVDPRLPQLRTVMTPSGQGALAAALESAARRVHDVPPDWRVLHLGAEPVRYKPGDRCVIRYRLVFGAPEGAGGAATATRTCTLVAKLYREPGEAAAAQDLLVRLRDRAVSAGPPGRSAWSPGSRSR